MAEDFIGANFGGQPMGTWRRGLASVAAMLAAMLLISLVLLVAQSNRAREGAELRERQSYEVMLVTRAVGASMARAEAALGRFVMSGDRSTGSLYFDEWRRAGRLLTRLSRITAESPEQAKLVGELKMLYDSRGGELAPAATRSNFGQNLTAVTLYYQAGKSPNIPAIDKLLAHIASNERDILITRSNAATRSGERSDYLVALLAAICSLLVLAAVVLGWATFEALAAGQGFRRRAIIEAERAQTLEQAVAARTRELSAANQLLREEAAEREAAEEQLRQVQKVEAMGQLTGGIAHDFNNMLAVIVGGLDLARRRLPAGETEAARHIDNAMEGADRAAALTRQLLTFARAEPRLPKGIEPGALIHGMSTLLDRTLGERIIVENRVEPGPWHIWCDPHQLENALLNLAVNARDAMNEEGRLVIATANVTLADREIGQAPAGDYVRIAVTDTGCGMTPDIVARAFEPFFTTKPVGKGTGLGLSQIFGFVRQSEGEVAILSRPGAGTTVALYLPRFRPATELMAAKAAPAHPIATPAPPARDNAGSLILVVEDDVRVRAATVAGLEDLGYHPLPCAGGEEAIALLADHPDIRLVITDVVMPGMTGPELIARIAPDYPHIAVLYVTGYAGDAGEGEHFSHHDLLRKPFTVSALETAVAQALNRREPTEQAA